jgi:hypothetical protein
MTWWTYLGMHLRQIRAEQIARKRLEAINATGFPHVLNPFLLERARAESEYVNLNLLVEGRAAAVWPEMLATLRKIKEESDRLRATLIVIALPSTIQVNASHGFFYRALGFRVDSRAFLSDRPQALLAAFCRQENIAFADPLSAFRAAASKELYLEDDDH